MHLHVIDIAIIIAYLVLSVLIGYWVSHRASRDMRAYFLGGNVMPWYILGDLQCFGYVRHQRHHCCLVYCMFVYGAKSVWIPVALADLQLRYILMVYMSTWLRRIER